VKKSCSDTFNQTCKNSGLGDAITKLTPSETGETLPAECRIQEGDSMKTCLAWINYNLLRNSLTVNFDKVYNLQATVSAANNVKTRLLQESSTSVRVVAEDPLTKYPETQIDKSSYELSENDLEVDGISSLKSISVSILSDEVKKGESNGSSFYSLSFGMMMIFVLIF
jgi:hypothetical protein